MIRIVIDLIGLHKQTRATAWKVNEFMAVHRDQELPKLWRITHIQTGFRMGSANINLRSEAVFRAEDILVRSRAINPHFDWSKSSFDELKTNKNFIEVMRAARAAAYGE